ncbi:Os09g0116600, partial [Oryza sativa Japonica Group]
RTFVSASSSPSTAQALLPPCAVAGANPYPRGGWLCSLSLRSSRRLSSPLPYAASPLLSHEVEEEAWGGGGKIQRPPSLGPAQR